MVEYINSTVFNAGTQTIVNTVNCQGVMGAGLALEYKLRYKEMFTDYKERCKQNEVKVGKLYLYRGYEEFWILNFPTKKHWKLPAKIEYIEEGLDYFVSNYQKGRIKSIAFPKLGSNKGGLDWSEVKQVMEKCLNMVKIPVFICLDIDENAQGVEGKMVELLNSQPVEAWKKELRITKNAIESLRQTLPVQRFSSLLQTPNVGKKTYENLFNYFYSIATEQPQKIRNEQLPMFNMDEFH